MSDGALRTATPRASAIEAQRWLEALPTPILVVDETGRIRYVNTDAADVFAAVGRALLGRRLADVFGADAPLAALARRASAAAARMAEADVPLTGPGFALGRAIVSAAPVGEGGDVALVLTLAPRTRAPTPGNTNTAARTLAHEVRNPLAGIRAAAQLIGRSGDPETAKLSQLICDEVDRMHRLTERIDPLGALEPPRFARFNIHEALGRVRQLLASSAPGVLFRERYDPSLPPLRGDLDQIIQALLNIGKNAVEAVNGREDAEVSFVTSYRPGVRMRSAASGGARPQLEVKIADNGPGLEADVAERVFEAFATTKPGGMGLGLTVAADIIARHDGRIEVETAPGRTAFNVLLPIDPEDDAP